MGTAKNIFLVSAMRSLALEPSCAETRVANSHAFTARMCAASRWEESSRPDSLFDDPLAKKLAGDEGLAQPMGSWIMTPRTRYADDYLRLHYANGCRQLVLLGAGMDSRAFRMGGLDDLKVFEVDQRTIFDVKEPLVANDRPKVAARRVVATDFTARGAWARDLAAAGFDERTPTVWILEGLLMYLGVDDARELLRDVGRISAPGSAAFHDACSLTYVSKGINVAGARFIGGSDDYRRLWAEHAGFDAGYARDFRSVSVDRRQRRVRVDPHVPEATPLRCRGRDVVLFVEAQKAAPANASRAA